MVRNAAAALAPVQPTSSRLQHGVQAPQSVQLVSAWSRAGRVRRRGRLRDAVRPHPRSPTSICRWWPTPMIVPSRLSPIARDQHERRSGDGDPRTRWKSRRASTLRWVRSPKPVTELRRATAVAPDSAALSGYRFSCSAGISRPDADRPPAPRRPRRSPAPGVPGRSGARRLVPSVHW